MQAVVNKLPWLFWLEQLSGTPLNLRFEPLYGLLFEIYFDILNFNTLDLFDTPNKKMMDPLLI